ncbi:AraC family transcriptional regulator [Agromyces bauzanensis]|uniref:Cupin n=1 Tax=Agromyces bauzanensis TaxID=1308924 RepID=A0A917PS52_9MICO|nr:AraC family transcriptional regulator [Agromyces bauzanensis]GGJ89833.1 cupin [Agromyces bauzanensis]
MDTLTHVLSATRAGGTRLDQLTAAAPWAVRLPDARIAAFHAVTEGTCVLMTAGRTPARLSRGDVALVPSGAEHVIASEVGVAPRRYADVTVGQRDRASLGGRIDLAGSGARARLLCGGYEHRYESAHPALARFPSVVRLPARAVAQSAIPATLDLLATELRESRQGAQAVISHLVDALFVQILRTWAEHDGGSVGWLLGIPDAGVAAALAAMHDDPARTWTVAELARAAGYSRTAFAERFAEVVGEPPLTYLTRWRMDIASQRLRDRDEPVFAVAHAVGYASEQAFSRAFRRARGIPPAHYRAEARGIRLAETLG